MNLPPYIQSHVLDSTGLIRHGFFTAIGGVSLPPYDSLNCSTATGDSAVAVAENRARVAESLGLRAEQLVSLKQVHSDSVYYVEDASAFALLKTGDGLVSNQAGIGLGVLTADCAPVLFADHQVGVIGAAHAGWRGALAGVCDAVIRAMCDAGASRGRICAAIGPAMQFNHYEVQSDFKTQFISDSPIPAEPYFIAQNSRIFFDNPGYLEARLRSLGLAHIDRSREDTYTERERYFSHRRASHEAHAATGRQLSVIALA